MHLRSLNKLIEDLDFPLPKLDEVVHLLKGANWLLRFSRQHQGVLAVPPG